MGALHHFALVLLALLGDSSHAFQSISTSSNSVLVQRQQQSHHHDSRRSSTSTQLEMLDPTAIGATICALATAAAAFQEYRTDKWAALKQARPGGQSSSSSSSPMVEFIPDETKAAAEKPEKKGIVARLNPLGGGGKTEKEEPVALVQEEAVVEEKERDLSPETIEMPKINSDEFVAEKKDEFAKVMEAFNENKKESSLKTKSTTELVQEVGMTKEGNEAMAELGEKRKQEKASKKAASEEATKAATPAKERAKAVTTTKKRGILRKTWRVIKKVIAPWRKWENIS